MLETIQSISAKDIILLIAGALLALPVTGGWSGLRGWIRRRGDTAEQLDAAWKARLTSSDTGERQDAFQEIVIRSLYQFVLGSMLVAVSGLAWIGDFLEIWPVQSLIAVVCSALSAVFFLSAAKWLKLYFRHRGL